MVPLVFDPRIVWACVVAASLLAVAFPFEVGAHYVRSEGIGELRVLLGVGGRILVSVPVPLRRLLSGRRRRRRRGGGAKGPHGTAAMESLSAWARASLGVLRIGLLRGRKVQELVWRTVIGTGDAALTSWTAGGLWGMKASALALAQGYARFLTPPRVNVVPDYDSSCFRLEFRCIIRTSVGHIILGIFSYAVRAISGYGRRG